MSWAVLQSGSNTVTSGGNGTFTFSTANLTSGSKIICWVVVSLSGITEPVTAVKDGSNNALTQLASVPPGVGTNTWVELWAMDTPAGDAGSKPTLTATALPNFGITMLVEEVTGLLAGNTSAMLDGTPATNTGTNSPATNGAYSSTAVNEFLAGCYGDPGDGVTVSNSTGYTPDTANVNASNFATCFVSYKNSTNGSESASWALSGAATDGWKTILAAFKLAGGGGGGGTPVPAFTDQAGYRPRWAPHARTFRNARRIFQPAPPQGNRGVAFPLWTRQGGTRPRWHPDRRRMQVRRAEVPWGQSNQGTRFPLWTRQRGSFPKWHPHVLRVRSRKSEPGWGQGNQGVPFPLWTRQRGLSPKWHPHRLRMRTRRAEPGWGQQNQGVPFPLTVHRPGAAPKWPPHVIRMRVRRAEPGWGQGNQGALFPLFTGRSRRLAPRPPRARLYQAFTPPVASALPALSRQGLRRLPRPPRGRLYLSFTAAPAPVPPPPVLRPHAVRLARPPRGRSWLTFPLVPVPAPVPPSLTRERLRPPARVRRPASSLVPGAPAPAALAAALLTGTGTLEAFAVGGPDLDALWAAYLAAAARAATLRSNWRLIRSVAATDGTAGALYAQLYEAEQAADAAHAAWQAAYRIRYPAPPG